MPSLRLPSSSLLLPLLVLLIFWARPAHCFGAGNIASTARIEGQNWRHGDIEDTLLTLLMTRASGGKKFSKMDVKRVYFGNWLRDYSQAVDVGALKMVSGEAIRILLWILGFLSFGYGTKEFEVTADRLGCYRPEEHIDNPKDYADNLDARQYDRRLRGPVDERVELGVDENTGLKNYIANERIGITTSAGHVRRLFLRCIQLGRNYNRNGNKADFYEALRLLGTGLHCLEDYSAHSNYTELALIEMGERDVFPHVGRRTRIQLRGARNEVYPIVTGTFGGVDFLHSVCGEVSDKATQSEIQELEGTIQNSQNQQQQASIVRNLLSKLPDGLFGGKDEKNKADELQANAAAHQLENTHISPKEPEAWAQQLQQINQQIYPVIEYHDEIMQGISEAIDNIPVLPELLEQVQEQVSIFVFSLMAPFILPLIKQVKLELETGSTEIIQSSRDKQHIVFQDDSCSDPTHSMLSKDHFTNILNEPAGKVASQVLKWAVPQIVECWDNEGADAERTVERIVKGVFHHPALRQSGDDGASDGRQQMFRVVEDWWREKSDREKDDFRDKLSRSGVENGRNHKEGVHDTGHGCGKPLGPPKPLTSGTAGGIGGDLGSNIIGNILSGGNQSGGGGRRNPQNEAFSSFGKAAGEAVGGGALGGLLGNVIGGVGQSLVNAGFEDDGQKNYKKESYNDDGSYTQSYGQTSHSSYGDGDKYRKSEHSQTSYPGGGREERRTYQQEVHHSGGSAYGSESRTTYSQTQSSYGQTSYSQSSYTQSGNDHEGDNRRKSYEKKNKYGKDSEDDDDDDDDDDWEKKQKKERKKREKEEKKRREKEESYGGGYGGGRRKDDDSDDDKYKRRSGEHKRQSGEYRGGYGEERRYGEQPQQGYGGGRNEYGAGRQDYGEGRQEYGGGRQEYGGGRQEYGGGREAYGGGREEYGGGRQEYGGGRQEYGRPPPPRDEFGGGRQEYGQPGMPGGFGEQSGGYGGPGGFGGGRRDDDDGGYGGGRRHGEGGYGRRDEERRWD